MNKTLKIILICLIVAGTLFAAFTDIPVADFCALAVACASAGALCFATWNKSEKKDWKVIIAVVFIAVGSFALGFAGVAGDAISKIIAAVGGVVLLIFGILATFEIKK